MLCSGENETIQSRGAHLAIPRVSTCGVEQSIPSASVSVRKATQPLGTGTRSVVRPEAADGDHSERSTGSLLYLRSAQSATKCARVIRHERDSHPSAVLTPIGARVAELYVFEGRSAALHRAGQRATILLYARLDHDRQRRHVLAHAKELVGEPPDLVRRPSVGVRVWHLHANTQPVLAALDFVGLLHGIERICEVVGS